MKRDQNLRNLSSDHHQALTLTRKIFKTIKQHEDNVDFISDIKRVFQQDLSPHFEIEEQALLPELMKAGEICLVNKTLEDHAELRMLANRLEKPGYLQVFAEKLRDHVCFEENTLFEACQNTLDTASLNRIGLQCARDTQMAQSAKQGLFFSN